MICIFAASFPLAFRVHSDLSAGNMHLVGNQRNSVGKRMCLAVGIPKHLSDHAAHHTVFAGFGYFQNFCHSEVVFLKLFWGASRARGLVFIRRWFLRCVINSFLFDILF